MYLYKRCSKSRHYVLIVFLICTSVILPKKSSDQLRINSNFIRACLIYSNSMKESKTDSTQKSEKVSLQNIIYMIIVLIVMIIILINNLGVVLELIGLDSVELPDWLLFIVAVIALFITIGSLVFIWKNKKTLINFDSRPFLG